MRSDGQPFPVVPQNAATAPAINRLRRLSVWETPPNWRRFHNNLYQAQLSGCSALPESRRQSLPHPYACRRTKFAPVKSLDSSEFSSELPDLKTLWSNVKVNPVISWNGQNSFHRIFLRIIRILLHLKFPSNSQDFTTPQTAVSYNQSTQTIGKLALFEKSCHSE